MMDLNGIRVLELATGISIPLTGAVLAHLGAEVIKIESRKKPDLNRSRAIPPEWSYGDPTETFWQFHEVNAGTKSVTLNLKHPKGRELLLALVARSHLLIQNFAPGWLERIGLSLDTFLRANPQIALVFASAYGQAGPQAAQRAYAPIMTGLAGLESLVGYDDGTLAGVLATALGDPTGSYYGVLYALSALFRLTRAQQSTFVDLSFVEAATTLVGGPLVQSQLTGRVPELLGSSAPDIVPHGIFPTRSSDAWVAVAAYDDQQWDRLSDVLAMATGQPEFWRDPMLRDQRARIARRAEVESHLGAWTVTQSVEEVVRDLGEEGIPAAPILPVEAIDGHPHFLARGIIHAVEHVVLGRMAITGVPWVVDGKAVPVRGAGPLLGSANEAVFREVLGLDGATYRAYEAEGVFD